MLQHGFVAQGSTDAVYLIEAIGALAQMSVDLPTTTPSIHTRSFYPVSSSGSDLVADATEIGLLSADHFLSIAPDERIEITLSGLGAGHYYFEGWWSDTLQNPGLVFQMLEFSTDGGSTFSTVSSTIDPSGLNSSPVSFPFVADGQQDVVIRVVENNSYNQLRLNAIAVPEPGFAWLWGSGLCLLVVLHRRETLRRNGVARREG